MLPYQEAVELQFLVSGDWVSHAARNGYMTEVPGNESLWSPSEGDES